ncbi:hypothetical protein BN1723_012993 [Verticillium longisporum]|uniref:Tetraspanin Tsp3 n=1 Tax=Verticillium longisporum TaxID=100787 RepID=A0A0G4LN49_VERLO|nr:hypothetical protein BN1708_000233 [Verticillium longisporum]CRK23482.1 hypothetical protein BN1723_012993 [Verticillium longisporum]
MHGADGQWHWQAKKAFEIDMALKTNGCPAFHPREDRCALDTNYRAQPSNRQSHVRSWRGLCPAHTPAPWRSHVRLPTKDQLSRHEDVFLTSKSSTLHITSANLSLPIAPNLTLTTILLLLLAALNTAFQPRLLQAARTTRSPVERILPQALQSLQAILTTALATLLLQSATASDPLLDCALASTWQRLFQAKDAPHLRAIQDTLDCCGYRSIRDRPWPFPTRDVEPGRCAVRFDRQTACAEPWRNALGRNAALGLAVVFAVAAMQIASLAVARGAESWRDAWWARRGGWWWRGRRRGLSSAGHEDVVRPLLGAPEAGDEGADSDVPVSYGDLSPTARPRRGIDDGVVENGSRVQPSSLEGNAWGGE